jgi:transcriptional regulator with XRE-family HTH domain
MMTTVERTSGAATAGPSPTVGLRIKALRDAMGLSLRDLAERSGVSAPMLSQVERGETSPTLSVAARIASGLELSLSQLLRLDETHHVVVVTKDERRAGNQRSSDHSFELLTPPLPGQRVELSEHRLKPGGATPWPSETPSLSMPICRTISRTRARKRRSSWP